jgi:hypothetical protein
MSLASLALSSTRKSMVRLRSLGNRAQVFLEQRFAAEHDEVWREVALVHALVAKRKGLRVRLEEEIERIEHRHLGDQVHLDAQLARLLREDVAGEVVSLRILLPVDEMLFGCDLQRIGNDPRAAMGSGTQSDDLWSERHEPVVAIVRDVIECDMYGHASFYTGPLLETAHQIAPKTGPQHHRDARTLRLRTFLNADFRLWYFWLERTRKQ